FIARPFFPLRPYDTASTSFYRICEFAVLHDNIRRRNEIEYFCHRQWPISSFPDPHDFDPERLAFLQVAALTWILCASFNARIAMGLYRDAPAYIMSCAIGQKYGRHLHTGPRSRARWNDRFVSMHRRAIPSSVTTNTWDLS
ncbi:hypothetical protein C8R45DRAFT_849597, partial [Mycena sanguinolenta]